MIELSDLPAINATLNLIAFMLLIAGLANIRLGRVAHHKRCMIAAFGVSMVFLGTYLTYRFFGQEKRFAGQGWIRPVYFFILLTHVTLAATVPVLASWTLILGLRGKFDKHRRLARVTFPIWVYVSITGVLVYLFLFKLFGPPVHHPLLIPSEQPQEGLKRTRRNFGPQGHRLYALARGCIPFRVACPPSRQAWSITVDAWPLRKRPCHPRHTRLFGIRHTFRDAPGTCTYNRQGYGPGGVG